MNYKNLISNRETRLKILNMCPLPDKIMIKLMYRLSMKKKLDLNNPITFNEKLNWLKLYDRNQLHSNMVDKVLVRDIIKQRIGEEYLFELLGFWDKYEDIPFTDLPEQFVMKCNHDSGSIKVVLNKSEIVHDEFCKFYSQRLKSNPYRYGREWPYKNVRPCILIEKYMGKLNGELPVDYKFFCFNGYVDSVMLCMGRGTSNERYYFFDKQWRLRKYNLSTQDLPDDFVIEKPKGIDKLFELAGKLSEGEKFVRIDFYIIDDKPYFGEFTFYPASGFDKNIVPWADKYLGDLIKIK